jgi:hypothetical protein
VSSGNWSVTLDGDNKASKIWSGVNNPKAENPYHMTHSKYSRTKGYMEFPTGSNPVLLYWGNDGIDANFTPYSNELLLAYSKLADAVKGHSFDASVFLGELSQTTSLITGNCEKVLSAYRALRRGNPVDCTRILFGSSRGPRKLDTRDLANFWIELQYGWKPLLSDVSEAVKSIDALRRKQNVVFRVSKRTTLSTSGVTSQSNWTNEKITGVALKAKFYDTCSRMQSLGLTSPVNVAWELLPWSFVVDWFVPVGTYLSSASLLSGLNYDVVISKIQSIEANSANHLVTGLSGRTPYKYYGGVYHISKCEFDRSVAHNPSIPLPSAKTMSQALSWGHLENAAALIRQQVHLSR